MRPQGSGISFFTMSTGMADTYRSAVMDSPVSRLYCLQSAGQGRRGELGTGGRLGEASEEPPSGLGCFHSSLLACSWPCAAQPAQPTTLPQQ